MRHVERAMECSAGHALAFGGEYHVGMAVPVRVRSSFGSISAPSKVECYDAPKFAKNNAARRFDCTPSWIEEHEVIC